MAGTVQRPPSALTPRQSGQLVSAGAAWLILAALIVAGASLGAESYAFLRYSLLAVLLYLLLTAGPRLSGPIDRLALSLSGGPR